MNFVATKIQVVFDCADPDHLAKFWAEALHYQLQDPPAGYASWDELLKAMGVPEADWNSASAIVDPEKLGPRIYFQQMDTPKPKKNRVHLDLNISGGSRIPMADRMKRVDAEVGRLAGLGATKQQAWDESGEYWVVMLDPEGNEFCVQ